MREHFIEGNELFFDREKLSDEWLLKLYKGMLEPRLIEEKMLILLRQGKISKWFSGIGQEAISIGVTSALHEDEYILPMHRNLGVFTARNIPLHRMFSQWQGTTGGFTKGRDRSFHFGTQRYKIIGMISHLGPQLGVACGIALGHKLRKEQKITAVFTGEGGTSEGDFHEALNVASVWDLPVLFCIENNGYGLSTPTREQYRCEHLIDRAVGYGMEGHQINGNNITEVFNRISEIAQGMREHPRPVLIEFETFRMRGHEEASGVKYVPLDLLQHWEKRDPLINYRAFLMNKNLLNLDKNDLLEQEIRKNIDQNLEIAFAENAPSVSTDNELQDVYAPFKFKLESPGNNSREIRFIDAIAQALKEAMHRHDNCVLMGQDIADYGGVFKITEGFVDTFGKDRVRNTPICESAIIEAGMGLSINGFKAIIELQFADFVSSGFNPIVNYLAKSHYRWGQVADVVLRMPCGAGVGAGPFHSQSNEAWFTHTPGLKVVYPAFPADAKGLLISAIEDPNPVLFFEHKALYRTVRQAVPTGYYNLPFGKAALLNAGTQISIITFGAPVHWALELIADMLEISIALIDLRTLVPLDWDAINDTVVQTGKVLLLTEDNLTGSFITSLAARIGDECFEYLDAPVKCLASLDTPIPFAKDLENNYLAKDRLKNAVKELVDY
ncbi:thiamine pyrophosphate-dependent enzyme [Flavimarina sp. Hel_I_48]|uniref:alpha-ketoacid dehydrogenase subunit alpha/beta n=1 Tax=Flavimarina sp. Hel_I_48 TaxID=1392488 RepID=UPI0004DFB33D|nr:dehydrogenase E1 component subunit alpha/beta [Flavimarina sp. Hel_I_48]